MGNFLCAGWSSSGGEKNDITITDTDKAVLSLKTQRKRLADQQRLMDARIDRHMEV